VWSVLGVRASARGVSRKLVSRVLQCAYFVFHSPVWVIEVYSVVLFCLPKPQGLALALLVARVLADDHHAAVAANDLALVADPLDAWVYLHDAFLLMSAVLVPTGCRESLLSSDLLVAVNDAAAGQIVRSQLHNHAVPWKDADVVLTHLAGNMGKYLVSIGQLDSKHCVWKSLNN
jgi:hypothetical protein